MKNTSYSVEILSKEEDKVYRFETADGVVSKDEVRDSVLALLDSFEFEDIDRLLNIDSNYGVLGILAAGSLPESEIVMTDSSARSVKLSRRNIQENSIENAEVELIPRVRELESEGFDTALYCPKPFEPDNLVKQKILEGMQKLEQNGEMFVSAHKYEGGKRYVSFLQDISGEVEVLSKSGGSRVARAEKDRELDMDDIFETYSYETEVREVTCSFTAAEGLFSPKSLDDGTRHLIENMEVEDGDRILDLACGYGPVAVYALNFAECDAVLTDDNALATSYARKNLALNSLEAEVQTADCLEGLESETFDRVFTNPPTHAGDGIVQELFTGAQKRLRSGGALYLVYNEVLDYEDDLDGRFSQVEILEERDGYKITKAVK